MLGLDLIRQKTKQVKEKLSTRDIPQHAIEEIIELDEKRREFIQKVESLQQKHNELSEEIAQGKPTRKKIAAGRELKKEIKELDSSLQEVEKELNKKLDVIPNLPQDEVPVGKDEEDNVVLSKVGKKPQFDFEPASYLDLGKKLNLIDISRAAKVAGSRFAYLKNELVQLEMALINFTISKLIQQGFHPILPPMMLKEGLMQKLGYQNLINNEDLYYLPKEKLNLVGTAEHSIGAMYQDEILQAQSLPRRFAGFSSCFRKEAGSYGKDTKGILRLHQFNKVEMFSFVQPENSQEEHQLFLKAARGIVDELQLPYRVVNLCTADLGQPSAITYDLETWIPSENRYRETHSISNCTDYQARGLNIRSRDKKNETFYVHTVNGTAIALERILIALMENHQTSERTIQIPKALHPYINFTEIK